MKFQCERENLINGLQQCQRAISTKSMLPILSGILIKSDGKTLNLSATDLEISVRTSIDVETKEAGSLVVPAKLILDILTNLDEEKVEISLIKEKGQLEILAGESRFDLNIFFEEDFPKIPESQGEPTCDLDADKIGVMIKEVAKAASRDDAKPMLTGVLVEMEPTSIKMVATDSYRLAIGEDKLDRGPGGNVSIIIPARSLRELNRIIATSDKHTVSVFLTDNQVIFRIGGVELISRLIEGEFPNYKQILPEGYEKKIRVNKGRFLGATKRVSLLAQNNTPVKVTTANNMMVISANTQDVGEATERMDVEFPGEEIKIAFNPQYLIDGITSVEGDELVIEVLDPLKPALIKPVEKDDFLYLIMPIRVS